MKTLCFAIIVIISASFSGCGTTSVTRLAVRERPDSALVQREPAHVVGAHSDSLAVEPARIEDVQPGRADSGSVVTQKPKPTARSIKAHIDTTLNGIRILADYNWPADEWNFNVEVSDTSVHWMVRDSIIEKPYPVDKTPLSFYFVLGGMGIALLAAVIALFKK